MTWDVDDEPDFDPDCDYFEIDDDVWPEKDEPACGACNDHGCRSCRPTWLQHHWWLLTWRMRWRLRELRWRWKLIDPNEPPF